MDETGLLRAYVEGQIGRRAFLRSLVRSGVSLAAAVAYADVLAAIPAEAATTEFYVAVANYLFDPNPAGLSLAQATQGGVQFGVTGRGEPEVGGHRLQSPPGSGVWFDSGWVTDGNYSPGIGAGWLLPGAGAYPYGCTDPDHGEMIGTIRVRPRLSKTSVAAGETVTVRWASGTNVDLTHRWDVQRKDPGASTWTSWRVATTATKRAFTPSGAGVYRFRARTHLWPAYAASPTLTAGWSPAVILTVP